MEIKFHKAFCIFLIGSLSFNVLVGNHAQANSAIDFDFQCESSSNRPPTTIMRSFDSEGNKVGEEQPVVSWESSLGNYSPEERCKAVTGRFQTLMGIDGQGMRAIVSGRVNGSPAICASRTSDGACSEETLLFTLRDERQLSSQFYRLEQILGRRITYGPIRQSDGSFFLQLLDLIGDSTESESDNVLTVPLFVIN